MQLRKRCGRMETTKMPTKLKPSAEKNKQKKSSYSQSEDLNEEIEEPESEMEESESGLDEFDSEDSNSSDEEYQLDGKNGDEMPSTSKRIKMENGSQNKVIEKNEEEEKPKKKTPKRIRKKENARLLTDAHVFDDQLQEEIIAAKKAGRTQLEISEQFKISRPKVSLRIQYAVKMGNLKIEESGRCLRRIEQMKMDRIEEIVARKKAGHSRDMIARALKMCRYTVACRVKHAVKLGLLQPEESKRILVKRGGRRVLTDEICEEMVEKRKAGMGMKEISELFGFDRRFCTLKMRQAVKIGKLDKTHCEKAKMEKERKTKEMHEQIWALKKNGGKSSQELADQFSFQPKHIDAICRKFMKREEQEEEEKKKLKTLPQAVDVDEEDKYSQVPNTLHSRFAVLPEHMVNHKLRKSRNYMCPNFYRLLLFRIEPFYFDTKTQKTEERLRKTVKKCWHPMFTKQTETNDVPPSPSDAPHRLYQYECFDCTFRLIGFPFVPIVYLICDHFLDCLTHLVRDDIRELFLRERESFTAFLGPDFNHDFLLPNEPNTTLTFHPFNSLNTYHCSLKLADDYCAQRAKEFAAKMEDFGEEEDEEEHDGDDESNDEWTKMEEN